jgi:hypothetical protein
MATALPNTGPANLERLIAEQKEKLARLFARNTTADRERFAGVQYNIRRLESMR